MDSTSLCKTSSDRVSDKLFSTVAEYYGVNDGTLEWRIDSKPGNKRNLAMSPFDLSDGLRRSNNLWKEDAFVTDLGLSDENIDILRNMSVPMGLKNMGATCYVNAFLQALFMNQEFSSLILTLSIPESSSELRAFQTLLAEMKYGVSKFADPKDFVDALSIGYNLQEDCSEFSTLFLTWLEQSLATHPSDAAGTIRSFFEGQFETTLICCSCNDQRKLYEPFKELRLELPDPSVSADLEQLLQAAMHYEDTIDGYFCSACRQRTVLIKRTSVVKSPPYLQLAINRYKFSFEEGVRRKVVSPVKIPLSKDFEICSTKYTCTGYLEHISSSATSGHYIANLRDESCNWWTFDDVRVSKTQQPLVKSSQSAYMVFLSSRFGASDLKLYPTVTCALRAVDIKNDILNARRDVLLAQQQGVKAQVLDRCNKIDQFVFHGSVDSSTDPSTQLHVISRDFFVSWCRGEDILGRADFASKSPFVKNLCGHARYTFHPSLVFQNEVKFVPKNVIDSMDLPYLPDLQSSACETCVTALESLLTDTMEYVRLLDLLRSIRMNFYDKSWEGGDGYKFEDAAVWINSAEIPRVGNKSNFASKIALFKRISKLKNTETIPVSADLSTGTVCPHGRVVPEVMSDSQFVLKPKKLVEDLIELSKKIFPDMASLVPCLCISEYAVYNPSGSATPCEQCADALDTVTSEWAAIIDKLTNLVAVTPPTRFDPGVTYYVLPGVWLIKLKSLLQRKRTGVVMIPDLKLDNTIICPHGDLLEDPTEGKDEKIFLVKGSDIAFIKSLGKYMRNTVLDDIVFPVVQRDAVNFTLGCAPPVCGACSAQSSSPKIVIRVLPEIDNCFENPTNGKRTSTHKPSRSKYIGVTQGSIDMNSLGIDVKTHLIDIGILEHSLYDIDPDSAIEKVKIFIPNPKVRGALIEVASGTCLADVIGEDDVLDTIYVEFTQDPQEEPAHVRHKVRKISKKPETEDAGFKGSLLRDR